MVTRVLRVDPDAPDPAAIAEAAAVLRGGGLVAFPTETVYGLGAHALDEHAVETIFRAKGRPTTDPMIVHVAGRDEVDLVARDVPSSLAPLANAFWPGPLTIILPKRDVVPAIVSAGLPTIGVRVPAHPIARALLEHAVMPIAAPSANRFGRPSPTIAAHVIADLDGAIDLIVDGGATSVGIESTVLDLTVSPPLVRRPGGVALAEIHRILPGTQMALAFSGSAHAQSAPGQMLRHYAPRVPLTLYTGPIDRIAERIAADARAAAASGSKVGILAPEEDLRALAPRLAAAAAAGRIQTARYGSRRARGEAARDLFRALREIEAAGVDVILASAPEDDDIGVAIIDRLTRAAEGRVVRV